MRRCFNHFGPIVYNGKLKSQNQDQNSNLWYRISPRCTFAHTKCQMCLYFFFRFSGQPERLLPGFACPVTIWSMGEGEHQIRPKNSQVNHLAGWRSCQVLWYMLISVHKAKIQYLLGPYWERLACLNKRQFGTLNMFYTVLLDDMIWYNPKNIAWIVVGGDQDYLSEILLQIQSIEMMAVMVGEWLPLFYWRWGGAPAYWSKICSEINWKCPW